MERLLLLLRKFYPRLFIAFTFIISLCLLPFHSLTVFALPVLTEETDRLSIPIETNAIPNWPEGPDVTAQSAILMDADSGAVLYAKNIHEQLYPASTTKILTCLLAVENCSLDEIVTFSHDAVFDTPRDSSNIAIDEGEELTLEQCLNAILIASANEVAFAVAEHISGSRPAFAELMNERAAQLGCQNSNFVNPNGLPDEDHYTTAYDLAMIGRAFFANELLCKISSTYKLEIPVTDKQPDPIVEYSRNQLFPGRTYGYEYLVGSKTGYTDAAKSTLVSCAEKDGMKLIAIVMATDAPAQYTDTISLFNYGFSNFDRINISETETKYNIDNAGFFYSSNDIFGSSRPILSLNTEDCIILPKTITFADVTSSISYDTGNGRQAALINYAYGEQFLGSVSVDFAGSGDGYSFEEAGTLQTPLEAASPDEKKEDSNVIFINIFKVLLWILGIAGAIILIILLHALFVNYQFGGKERNNRRSWLKDRRKKRNRYQKNNRRTSLKQARVNNRRRRRSDRR